MYRGTTPRLQLRIKGIDLSLFESVYITFEQSGKQVEKTGGDLIIDAENSFIYVPLSQQETLKFVPPRTVRVQLRALCKDGSAVASSISEISICGILKDGVITHG